MTLCWHQTFQIQERHLNGWTRTVHGDRGFYRDLVCSLAMLARDDQKLRDVLKSLSTEELRTLVDCTSRINYEAETWLY